MTTYEDLFRRDMDCYLKEYRDKLATNVRNGLTIESWKDVRDTLLFDFPKLRECYAAHGREQDTPRDLQSEKAKLGRMLAGAMASIRNDMWDVHPKPCLSKAVADAIEAGGGQVALEQRGARLAVHVARMRGWRHITDEQRGMAADAIDYARNWIKQTPITAIGNHHKRDLSNHPMMLELGGLKPGQQMSFTYRSKEAAKEDQSYVAWFAQALGWYKTVPDGRRPYATSTEEDLAALEWTLTIQRLDTSKPLPVSRKRG